MAVMTEPRKRLCGCCGRLLDETLGDTYRDDFGVWVWVCDECWSGEADDELEKPL